MTWNSNGLTTHLQQAKVLPSPLGRSRETISKIVKLGLKVGPCFFGLIFKSNTELKLVQWWEGLVWAWTWKSIQDKHDSKVAPILDTYKGWICYTLPHQTCKLEPKLCMARPSWVATQSQLGLVVVKLMYNVWLDLNLVRDYKPPTLSFQALELELGCKSYRSSNWRFLSLEMTTLALQWC